MKRLRGSRAFASVMCAACGTAWRPREEIGGYRLHEQLARGGFSLIFHASDPAGGGSVAVKIFALPHGYTPEDSERFTDEVQILAAHEHPHWLRIFGGGVENDFAWLAMEWLSEGSLPERGRMDENEALEAAAQIANALVAAHARGLQHRNLHIGECLLADARTVKVSGFAEAALYERAGLSVGTIWGRLFCTPPERLFEEPEDARSEIYALGAILFQLLTGELPYEGETMPEIFIERLDGPPPEVPAIRESTAMLLNRMLAVDPRERFSSWEETAAFLHRELEASRPAAESTPPVVARPAPKPPVDSAARGAWFTVVMLAGIVAIAGWFGWKHWPTPQVETPAPVAEIIAQATPLATPVTTPKPAPAPVVATVVKSAKPRRKPATQKMDWSAWKNFALDPAGPTGNGEPQPDGTTIRIPVSPNENVFFARELEGNWRLAARVSGNDGLAGIVARESVGSDRPCVGLVVAADGALNSVIRRQAGEKLVIAPVVAASRWLRIVRSGGTVSAYHSTDGQHWQEAATLNLASLPAKMPAGFVVWSGSKDELEEATFEDVALHAEP